MRSKRMKTHNKIVIASQLFERAHEIFESAESEADFASSLLLAGAVVGIIAPFLAEQGGHPTHDLLARIANATAEADFNEVRVSAEVQKQYSDMFIALRESKSEYA